MIVDAYTHVLECRCPIGEQFIDHAKVTAGEACKGHCTMIHRDTLDLLGIQ